MTSPANSCFNQPPSRSFSFSLITSYTNYLYINTSPPLQTTRRLILPEHPEQKLPEAPLRHSHNPRTNRSPILLLEHFLNPPQMLGIPMDSRRPRD